MKNLTIKESLGEAFFVKCINNTVAAFQKREHAELFIKILNEQEEETTRRKTQRSRPSKTTTRIKERGNGYNANTEIESRGYTQGSW